MTVPIQKDRREHPPQIGEIARWVLSISGVVILVVASIALIGAAISGATAFTQTSQLVFNALLPLVGTWVGTVLAYYFSRKTFASTSQSVERMVGLTAEQQLRNV